MELTLARVRGRSPSAHVSGHGGLAGGRKICRNAYSSDLRVGEHCRLRDASGIHWEPTALTENDVARFVRSSESRKIDHYVQIHPLVDSRRLSGRTEGELLRPGNSKFRTLLCQPGPGAEVAKPDGASGGSPVAWFILLLPALIIIFFLIPLMRRQKRYSTQVNRSLEISEETLQLAASVSFCKNRRTSCSSSSSRNRVAFEEMHFATKSARASLGSFHRPERRSVMNAGFTRRSFLGSSLAVGALVPPPRGATADEDRKALEHRLDEIAATPVLRVDGLEKPVKIASMELLRNGRNFLVRVRTADGAEGIGVPNAMHLVHTYPIFLNRVAPFFVGKDARQLEPLLWELYRHNDNYKYQGLALWVCVAAAEFAILDLLGKLTKRSIGDLLGGVKRRDIAVYRASGVRGNTPEEEVAYLKQLVAETGRRR